MRTARSRSPRSTRSRRCRRCSSACPTAATSLHPDAVPILRDDFEHVESSLLPDGSPVGQTYDYRHRDLLAVLTGIMAEFEPTVVRIADTSPASDLAGDHADHIAVAGVRQARGRDPRARRRPRDAGRASRYNVRPCRGACRPAGRSRRRDLRRVPGPRRERGALAAGVAVALLPQVGGRRRLGDDRRRRDACTRSRCRAGPSGTGGRRRRADRGSRRSSLGQLDLAPIARRRPARGRPGRRVRRPHGHPRPATRATSSTPAARSRSGSTSATRATPTTTSPPPWSRTRTAGSRSSSATPAPASARSTRRATARGRTGPTSGRSTCRARPRRCSGPTGWRSSPWPPGRTVRTWAQETQNGDWEAPMVRAAEGPSCSPSLAPGEDDRLYCFYRTVDGGAGSSLEVDVRRGLLRARATSASDDGVGGIAALRADGVGGRIFVAQRTFTGAIHVAWQAAPNGDFERLGRPRRHGDRLARPDRRRRRAPGAADARRERVDARRRSSSNTSPITWGDWAPAGG